MNDKNKTNHNIFNAKEYLSVMAPIVDIKIEDTWEAMVCSHLTTASQMAQIINLAPIDENSIELANTYKPETPKNNT